jgi:hypothetical protein
MIIPIVKAAVDIAFQVGLPEARIPLADAVVLVCNAPKSNSAYLAYDAAAADIRAGRSGPVPRTLQNVHYDGEDNPHKGQFYIYPHDYENHWVAQQYLPDVTFDTVNLYAPVTGAVNFRYPPPFGILTFVVPLPTGLAAASATALYVVKPAFFTFTVFAETAAGLIQATSIATVIAKTTLLTIPFIRFPPHCYLVTSLRLQ